MKINNTIEFHILAKLLKATLDFWHHSVDLTRCQSLLASTLDYNTPNGLLNNLPITLDFNESSADILTEKLKGIQDIKMSAVECNRLLMSLSIAYTRHREQKIMGANTEEWFNSEIKSEMPLSNIKMDANTIKVLNSVIVDVEILEVSDDKCPTYHLIFPKHDLEIIRRRHYSQYQKRCSEAFERLRKAIKAAGIEQSHNPLICLYDNRYHWMTSKVLAIIDPVLSTGNYCTENTVKISGDCVYIRSINAEYGLNNFNHPKNQAARSKIEAVEDKILKITGAKRINLSLDDGLVRYPIHRCMDDDEDCYDENPNWPSKTGNPSGGGRGNNPPRR